MGKRTFSTILYVDHQELFPKALENLKQNSVFGSEVQLIVVDPWLSEETEHLCRETASVQYVPADGAEVAQAYNMGLPLAEGKYLNFALASATYSDEIYQKAGAALAQSRVKIVTGRPFFVSETGELIQYKGSTKAREKREIISLLDQPHRIQLALQAYFFQRKLLEGIHFDESIHDEALYRFLLEVLAKEKEYFYVRYLEYRYTAALEDNPSINPMQYQPWWYQDSITNFIIPFLRSMQEENGRIPLFLQVACFYLIYAKYDCNFNDRYKGVIKSREEAVDFAQKCFQAMMLIENTVIMEYNITSYCQANRSIRMLLLRGKAEALNCDLQIVDTNGRYVAIMEKKDGTVWDNIWDKVAVLSPSNRELLRIRIMNCDGNVLTIEAEVGAADMIPPEAMDIFAVSGEKNGKADVIRPEKLQVYPLLKCFGYTFQRKYHIRFRVPVMWTDRQVISFYYEYDGVRHPFRITFGTPNSRMDAASDYSYWIFREGWMLSWFDKSELIVRRTSRMFHIKRELLYCKELYTVTEDKKLARRGIWLRLLYWLKKASFSKKHVWVTFDKLYKAGDNGEYMYQYIRREHPEDVEIYYLIRKEAPDYERMVREDKKHILVFGTLRCQLICLLAEVLLATHANISAQYNPTIDYRPFTKDLQRGELVCIQHGLTVQKIAQYQNQQFDNTRLYCCASPFEVENVNRPIYGYAPEEVKLVGMARYDGLVNRDQKIILITPSWRRNVVNSSMANTRRTHNDNFRNSAYFRIYNQLINDQRLIDCARRQGYRIVYLLHPAMSAQINDFDRNDYVELVPATGNVSYEKILCESSLMVTDYSGVQFDFAYMRKPILYYHPDELPPHYDEGGMIYSTMGFGPICTGHEQLVDELCRAMERGCTMEEFYIQRANSFFAFDDHNNCQRIYDLVWDWMQKRQAAHRKKEKK